MKLFLVTFFGLMSQMAFATGSSHCSVKDSDLSFELNAVHSRGFLGAIVNSSAQLKLVDTDGAPARLNYDLEKDHVLQYWADNDSLKFGLYQENYTDNGYSSIEIVIRTERQPDDFTFKGTMDIKYDQFENGQQQSGSYTDREIVCFVD